MPEVYQGVNTKYVCQGTTVSKENLLQKVSIQPVSDQAINIDFGEVIAVEVNQRVTSLAAIIRQRHIAGITACIPTYRSLTLVYDSVIIRQSELIPLLEGMLHTLNGEYSQQKRWQIPVCYGGEYGVDLERSAVNLGLTPEELIFLHSRVNYRIYMIGFMPGFAYLGD